MLKVDSIAASYGQARVLFDVSLEVGKGRVVAMLGRNGMGKTTTLKAIMGLLPKTKGSIKFNSCSLDGMFAHQIAQLGIGYVPEGRRIFSELSVDENLVATAAARHNRAYWDIDKIFALFPRLKERRSLAATKLSGGEQQMLAIGRALMTNPELVILDEATEGLAPLIRTEIWECLRFLKEKGHSILLVDKNIQDLLPITDELVVLEKGQVKWKGSSEEFRNNRAAAEIYLKI